MLSNAPPGLTTQNVAAAPLVQAAAMTKRAAGEAIQAAMRERVVTFAELAEQLGLRSCRSTGPR